MGRLTGWAAELLVAAWQRQEWEGRYRGADDFRALHIDPADALASWRATTTESAPWPPTLTGAFDDATAWVPAGLGLSPAERLVISLATAVELEPRLRPLVAALTDDPGLRQPTVSLAIECAGAVGLRSSDVRAACGEGARLEALGLIAIVPVAGRPSRADAQVVASSWLTDLADGVSPAEPEGLTRVTATPGGPLRVPALCSGADHRRHAEAATAPSGRATLLTGPDPARLGGAVRDALILEGALVVAVEDAPEAWLIAAVERAVAMGCPTYLSLPAGVTWVPPAQWGTLRLRPPDAAERVTRWTASLAGAGVAALAEDVAVVSSDYALGIGAIDEAATRVRAAASAPPVVATLDDLRLAARRTAWRDLSSCARPGPAGNTWDDLVVTDAVRAQLHDVAAAIRQRGRVLDVWGFGGRPGSRGYHVLFAGPSGTGKTMSAGVIAGATGLELWVVDLARVVDKYLGETEKAIDKVLRAAEASGAMLLFDEADALFGRRGEVREAKDRWANVEVAFLLQRIEEHDGVTVLTTNVSHHLDEAFARRMSQRVEFNIPDARLRRRLWLTSIPASAPVASPEDLRVVADRFELAGGAIRTAALNAAYAAAAAGASIGLPHLVRATVQELAKAGRTPTRADLGDLGDLVAGPS